MGWFLALCFLVSLTVAAEQMSASSWVAMNMLMHACIMVADVAADGLCVALGHLETERASGQVQETNYPNNSQINAN